MTRTDIPIRAISRIINEWAFDLLKTWLVFFDGDVKMASICLVTQLANTEYILNDPAMSRKYRDSLVNPEDCIPIPITKIAQIVKIDEETVRRRVVDLTKKNLCETQSNGVIFKLNYLQNEHMLNAYVEIPDNFGKMIDRLRRVILEGDYLEPQICALRSAIDIDIEKFRSSRFIVALHIARFLSRSLLEQSFIFADNFLAQRILFAIYIKNLFLITDDPVLSAKYAYGDIEPADGEKNPVSINRIAKRLNISAETCRRHVLEMIEDGVVIKTKRGIIANIDQNILNIQSHLQYQRFIKFTDELKRI